MEMRKRKAKPNGYGARYDGKGYDEKSHCPVSKGIQSGVSGIRAVKPAVTEI